MRLVPFDYDEIDPQLVLDLVNRIDEEGVLEFDEDDPMINRLPFWMVGTLKEAWQTRIGYSPAIQQKGKILWNEILNFLLLDAADRDPKVALQGEDDFKGIDHELDRIAPTFGDLVDYVVLEATQRLIVNDIEKWGGES